MTNASRVKHRASTAAALRQSRSQTSGSAESFRSQCCCEAMYEITVQEMADDPVWARALLQRAGVEVLTGHQLRRVADDGGCTMLLDHKLELHPISFSAARTFVAHHHRHCGPPVTWRFGTAVFNWKSMVGVVMVGNPVARLPNGRGTLEVNRLCIRRDLPRALAWNAASKLYGWAAREAERRGWVKIITYTRSDEEGTSVAAAGWVRDGVTRGRAWHSKHRSRSNTNAFIDKVRWCKQLRICRDHTQRRTRAPEIRPASLALDDLFDTNPCGGDTLHL